MIERTNDKFSWKIIQIGWQQENHSKLIEALKIFRRDTQDYLLEDSLQEYLDKEGKNLDDFEFMNLRAYCAFFINTSVRKDMCLHSIDIQRQNEGFDFVTNLKYEITENEVTLTGTAIRPISSNTGVSPVVEQKAQN